MKRLVTAIVAVLAIAATTATAGFADAGAPGSTFPEQPGMHTQTACAAVLSNPGTGAGGAAGHMSATAGAITTGLVVDACLGG